MVVFTNNNNPITSTDGRVWSSWTLEGSTNSTWTNWTTIETELCNSITITNFYSTSTVVWGDWALTREQKQEARKQKILERRKQSEIADRAKLLLFALLDDEEQLEFRRYGSVRIQGKRNIYEIGERTDLVTVLDEKGIPQHELCLHSPHSYPKLDRLAATLLALRFDEIETVKRGNKHPMYNRLRDQIIARRRHSRAA